MDFSEKLSHAYFFAKNYIISKGYSDEIDWQDEVNLDNLSHQKFLNEIAWVILAGGMNDTVVRKVFPVIKEIMFGFKYPGMISANKEQCYRKSLKIFNHPGKINAIIFAAEYLKENPIAEIKNKLLNEGVSFIQSFPYLGKATSFHFAKNIGLNCAKPDRHLIRIADALGFDTPHVLCSEISKKIHEKTALIDLVLWRYATLDKNYIENINWYLNRRSQISA